MWTLVKVEFPEQKLLSTIFNDHVSKRFQFKVPVCLRISRYLSVCVYQGTCPVCVYQGTCLSAYIKVPVCLPGISRYLSACVYQGTLLSAYIKVPVCLRISRYLSACVYQSTCLLACINIPIQDTCLPAYIKVSVCLRISRYLSVCVYQGTCLTAYINADRFNNVLTCRRVGICRNMFEHSLIT